MAATKTKTDHYQYSPSIVAAAIFIVIFAILTILHTYRIIKTRLWFCLPFTVGGLCMLLLTPRFARSLTFIMHKSPRLTD